jgi:nucleoside-diphosphate-sugar epimerase
VKTLTGAAVEPEFGEPRAGDVRDSQADIGKARHLLGYEPLVSFEEGLEKTVAWYRESASPSR